MRTMMMVAATATAALAAPLSARQVPQIPPGLQIPKGLGEVPIEKPEILDPNPTKVHGCLRPDVEANKAQIASALAGAKPGKAPAEVKEVQRKVSGCAYYRVTLDSKLQIDDTELPGVMSTISGSGSITFGLTHDVSEPDYNMTSGVHDLTAPIEWTAGSANITKPNCEVTITPLPYTLFGFWLGVSDSKVSVRITPEGNELHPTQTRCKDYLGRWSARTPGTESIFAPAWIRMHGEGRIAAPQSADQQEMIKLTNAAVAPNPGGKPQDPVPPKLSTLHGVDMAKLKALQQAAAGMDLSKMDPNDAASMAKLGDLMRGAVPNADAQLAAARDNFMFTCAAVAATKWQCSISQNAKKMRDRLGYGTIKAISEQTVITIEKVSTPPGGP